MIRIFKWALLLIIFATFLNGIAFICFGMKKIYEAYHGIFATGKVGVAGIELVHSLDNFLIALVFLIFSFGFAQLFLPENDWFDKINIPALKVNSFKELKIILWITILLTLVIAFASQIVSQEIKADWESLSLPICIVLLAGALRLLNK